MKRSEDHSNSRPNIAGCSSGQSSEEQFLTNCCRWSISLSVRDALRLFPTRVNRIFPPNTGFPSDEYADTTALRSWRTSLSPYTA